MILCRDKEIKLLNKLYDSNKFEFLVLYGRRRVGKTTLLKEFARTHKVIFFSAREKNDALNLHDFSVAVETAIEGRYYSDFVNWEIALEYISDAIDKHEEKLVLIIDEFPFIAQENPSIKSSIQHIIDHVWQNKKFMMILCGSSVSFMEEDVLGYKSPLYGRSTRKLELKAFDYYDSACFLEKYTPEEKIVAYGILGGIPSYLKAFDTELTIEENIASNILPEDAFLNEEPLTLLKMEVNSPAVYNSILESIAQGATKLNDISMKSGLVNTTCNKYMGTLKLLRLVNKLTPCGENEQTKKTIYKITDNYLCFWYRYLFRFKSYYDIIGCEDAAKTIMDDISNYMGGIFEGICQQYMMRMAMAKKLPFAPAYIGKWWGNNPIKKKQDDVDVLCLDITGNKAIFCECKFKNEAFDIKEFEDLVSASNIFSQVNEKYYYIFAKGGFTKAVKELAKNENIVLVGLEDLFTIQLKRGFYT